MKGSYSTVWPSRQAGCVVGGFAPEAQRMWVAWRVWSDPGSGTGCFHTVEYVPFIQSQLASRNQRLVLMWCKIGHVTVKISTQRKPRTPPCGQSKAETSNSGHEEGAQLNEPIPFQSESPYVLTLLLTVNPMHCPMDDPCWGYERSPFAICCVPLSPRL